MVEVHLRPCIRYFLKFPDSLKNARERELVTYVFRLYTRHGATLEWYRSSSFSYPLVYLMMLSIFSEHKFRRTLFELLVPLSERRHRLYTQDPRGEERAQAQAPGVLRGQGGRGGRARYGSQSRYSELMLGVWQRARGDFF